MLEHPDFGSELSAFFGAKRDRLIAALAPSGLGLPPAQGSFFQLIDYGAFSTATDTELAEQLLLSAGVATIPLSVFYQSPPPMTLLRLCIAKRDATLDTAAERLVAYTQRFFGRYRSVSVPSKASAANATVSDSVGCACTVRPMSARIGAHLDRQRDLGDQLAGVGADDAGAEQTTASCGSNSSLVKPSSRPIESERPLAAQGNTRLLDRDVLRLGRALGQTHPGDLRIGVGDRGNRRAHRSSSCGRPPPRPRPCPRGWPCARASAGPTISPIAKMCGTLVRICLSVAMKPRSSTCTPARSAPMRSPLGVRPTATSTWS